MDRLGASEKNYYDKRLMSSSSPSLTYIVVAIDRPTIEGGVNCVSSMITIMMAIVQCYLKRQKID